MGCRHFSLKKLSPQEYSKLDIFMKRAALSRKRRVRRRGNAVYFSSQGQSVQEISQELKISERSVWRWLHKYERQGVNGLVDRSRQSSLTPDQVAKLMKLRYPSAPKIYKKAMAWSYRKLAQMVKEKWHINISPQRLSQIIRLRMRLGG